CGGSGGSETPSKQEFVAQANRICASGQRQIKKQAAKEFSSGNPSTAEQKQFIAKTVGPSIQAQTDRLSHLTPPEGQEDEVQKILDTAQATVHKVKQDPGLAVQGSGSKPYAKFDRLVRSYSIETCGR